MARITPDTFDPLRSYISVRLLQGVPLVDADWNEAHDVRKFEVQAFLKWFVGNGVPAGNDGFCIDSLTSVRVKEDDPPVWDFVIRRGVEEAPADTSHVEQGLRHVGRCLVDGMDVLITEDLHFRDQPLHVSQGGAAALASLLGVPTIADIPVGDDSLMVYDPVVIYLDVWERLVTPDEEPCLVHSGLGVESSARLKREWVVRARTGTSVPVSNNLDDADDFIAGHSYYALATIAHQVGDRITDKAITDQRERKLFMPPATLIEDVFGPVDYRRGQARPLVNLREAINALLRGEMLGSSEASIGSGGSSLLSLSRGTFFDATNGLITTWSSGQIGRRIFAAQLDLATPEAGFRPIQQITGPINSSHHHATPLDTGEILIVYETEGEAPNVVMKRGTLGTLNPNSPAIIVTDTAASERFPFAVTVGRQVLILWHEGAGNTWQFKWYDPHNDAHPFGEARQLSNPGTTADDQPHTAVDSTNTVWVAFTTHSSQSSSEIQVMAVPLGGLHGQPQPLITKPFDRNRNPFVMVDNKDNVWILWCDTNEGGIWYRRFLRDDGWEPAEGTQVPGTSETQVSPTAVGDAEGGVWLFWARAMPSGQNIWYTRYNPVTQIWTEPRQITRHLVPDDQPFVLCGPDGSFWLFWRRAVGNVFGLSQPFYRRIVLLI